MSTDTILPYALTTLQRVKDRIYDANAGASQPTTYDNLLIRMINGCTDWFERECGARRFVLTFHPNDIYSAANSRQSRVITRQAPVFFHTFTGNMTLGSNQITAVNDTTGLAVGMPVAGDNLQPWVTTNGIQLRNYVTAVSGSTVTLAGTATAAVTTGYFQANGIVRFQWRPGTPSNPQWFDFIPDQFELVNNGKAGTIRVYGEVPRIYNNMIRINYWAGYPVDWPNAGNNTTHKLPSDLSDTVEALVVRRFKRRVLAGKGSEGLENATTSWNKDIDAEDQAVIGHYQRMPTIF